MNLFFLFTPLQPNQARLPYHHLKPTFLMDLTHPYALTHPHPPSYLNPLKQLLFPDHLISLLPNIPPTLKSPISPSTSATPPHSPSSSSFHNHVNLESLPDNLPPPPPEPPRRSTRPRNPPPFFIQNYDCSFAGLQSSSSCSHPL
jgi:hypothetical protein